MQSIEAKDGKWYWGSENNESDELSGLQLGPTYWVAVLVPKLQNRPVLLHL